MKSAFGDLGMLLLRLALGSVIFAHGAQKVMGWFGGPGMQGVVAWMGSMGIPAPMAYLAGYTEFLGGIAIALGILPRIVALGIVIDMLTAIATVHFKNGFFLHSSAPGGGDGVEFVMMNMAAALAVLLIGPGRYALWDPLARRGRSA